MQRLVIINYGSGNLHSAAKAFERAARESEADVAHRGERRAGGRGRRRPHRAAGRRRVRRLQGRRSTPWPACARRWRRACARKGRPFLGICVGAQLMAERGLEFRITPGFGWIKGDVQGDRAEGPDAQDPAHGLEHADGDQRAPAAGGIETGPTGLHAYFVHSFHLVPRRSRDAGGGDGLRWTGDRDGGGRQHRGHAVPPGEEPDAGTCGSSANFLKWRP